jgi:hypothetical protein
MWGLTADAMINTWWMQENISETGGKGEREAELLRATKMGVAGDK